MSNENVIDMSRHLSKRLKKYVQKKFLSDKITADDYSVDLLFDILRRVLWGYTCQKLADDDSVINFTLVSKGEDEYGVEISILSSMNATTHSDKDLSIAVGNMFAKELIKAKERNSGVKVNLKNIQDHDKAKKKNEQKQKK